MSEHGGQAADRAAVERTLAALEDSQALRDANVTGPVTVLSSARRPDGGIDCEMSASRLIPLAADDPALVGVAIATPVTGTVSVSADGTISAPALPEPTDQAKSEARAWARSLIANGQVRGIAASAPRFGPPARPTHELVADGAGHRVIRRIGFDAA